MEPHATLEPHPQEPKSPSSPYPLDLDSPGGSKNHWWIWLLIFGLIGYGCYRLYNVESRKQEARSGRRGPMRADSIPVVAAAARRGDLPFYLPALGTVAAFNTVTVKSRVDGQLTQVAFTEGQNVKEGDLLGEVDPRPYQVALEQAKTALAQARGNLAKDEAALRDAQTNYARDTDLFREKIIARQQLDSQLAATDGIKGSIQADQAAIYAAQASIDAAQLNLVYTRITAPIGGRIGLRQLDRGNMIHASDATGLAVIAQLQPIAVLFSIPEDQLQSVLKKLYAGVTLRADAYDRDEKRKLASGTLLTVDNQIDQTTGTSKLKAVFPNTDHALFPNQFVNIRLALDTQKNAVIVPSAGIQRGPNGTFVYLVQDDDTVSIRAVKTGLTFENDIAIEDGLQAGDRVVVDGAEKLKEGMRVALREPAAGGIAAKHGRSNDSE